ncbi:MAG TPA: ABC transporter permease [Opitutaceae bacterium]|jgi:predicted permease|nr:ABC transporter permease [Opitutaceae bacterium]
MQDIRYAFRQLAKTPGFTLVAVLTLALCIGANSAVFSVLHTILLKPYPWPDSDRLVYADNAYPQLGLQDAGVSIPDYLDRRQGVTSFEDSAMYSGTTLNLAGSGEPQMVNALEATPSLFTTLRSQAALGRTFGEDDAKPGAPATVVLSNALWKKTYGADPSIVGSTIRLSDRPVTVVGVMPEGFYFPDPTTQAWVPFTFTPQQVSDAERGREYSRMIARLKPGVGAAAATREMDLIQARNALRLPNRAQFWKAAGFHGQAVGYLENNVAGVRRMLWLVQAAVAAALLIGCANVAGLLLARAVGREKELAIRTALGASRFRMVRLLLTESLVLFLTGGLLGLAVASWGIDGLRLIGLSNLPRGFEVSLDPAIFGFTLACALVTGLVFGTLPALSSSRNNPSASLKEAGARGSAGRRTQRLRGALVVAEIALAVMLAATTSLLIKSFITMQKVDPGFVPGGVMTAQTVLPDGKYDTPAKVVAFHDAVIASLAQMPGVTAAGATDFLPFSSEFDSGTYTSPDIPLAPGAPEPHGLQRTVDAGYMKALGLTVLQGRWFNDSDTATAHKVVVVDRVLVDKYWKGQNPVGKQIRYNKALREVVGVVGTVKNASLDEASTKESLYYPVTQLPQSNLMFVVRTSGKTELLGSAISSAVHAVDPTQPVFNSQALANRLDEAAQSRRTPVVLLSVFGGIAMVLAMLGVYGVLSFSVAQRTTEFGVRMALGATARDIAALVLKSGLVLIGSGVVLGLMGYVALNRLVESLLFGTTSLDPAMLAAAPLLLAIVAIAACLLPALGATRIAPIAALRGE